MAPVRCVPRPGGQGVHETLAPKENVFKGHGSQARPPAATLLPPALKMLPKSRIKETL